MEKNCVLFSDLSPFFLRNWERGYLDYLERASYPRQFYLDYITTISSILTKFCRIDQRKKCQSSHYSKWRNYFKWWHNVWRRTYNWSCRWPRDRPSPSTGLIKKKTNLLNNSQNMMKISHEMLKVCTNFRHFF